MGTWRSRFSTTMWSTSRERGPSNSSLHHLQEILTNLLGFIGLCDNWSRATKSGRSRDSHDAKEQALPVLHCPGRLWNRLTINHLILGRAHLPFDLFLRSLLHDDFRAEKLHGTTSYVKL